MARFDMSPDELARYLPDREEPPDFDDFWLDTLDEQDEQHPLSVEIAAVDNGLTEIITQDVTFTGFGGAPIRAWYHRPAHRDEDLPVVVRFIGYNGGRGLPHQTTLMAQTGFAVLVMDSRGQGGRGNPGHTGDSGWSGSHVAGFLTAGITSPKTYYYRRIYTDAARAVLVAHGLPGVDGHRVLTQGASQGGALSLAAAYLSELRGFELRGMIADVPFLTHIRRATEITDASPFSELTQFLHVHRDKLDVVFSTLSYIDGVNLAARIHVPGLFSVGLFDEICPPSCVYAGYNHYAGEKKMIVYPYNGHENGEGFQELENIRFARERLG